MSAVIHPFPPLYDARSRVLILGSFPSVKSREAMFFYGHPRNRFWRVLAALLGCGVPQTVEEKKSMLHAHHLALWDVIASCEISGSSDSSIKNAKPNDILPIINESRISAVFANGNTAARLYEKYVFPSVKIRAAVLPSTSPANARFTLEMLIESWSVIKTR